MTATADARKRIGAAVRRERERRGMSVEAAAKAGGVGHMTWRKVEQGRSVYRQTYAAVDRALEFPSGRTVDCVDADNPTPIEYAQREPSAAPTAHSESTLHAGAAVSVDRSRPLRGVNGEEIPAIPNQFGEPDSFDIVLSHVESLTITQLQALNSIVERTLDERNKAIDSISKLAQNMDLSVPEHKHSLAFQTSESVGQEYQLSYVSYMQAWADFQSIVRRAYDLKSEHPVNGHEFGELWKQSEETGARLESAISRFSVAERQAIIDFHQNVPVASPKSSTTHRETE